ncbi:MAG: hypothetical protein PW735_00260 [Acidobacteriaceae bacterium]|nr:hypothetical protein [Acidobacteriaceae bacterium]
MRHDTRTLIRTGSGILGTGILAVLLMLFAFGGISRQGPHTNPGWLMLMLAMASLPTGLLTFLLGLSKLLRERSAQNRA